MGNPVVRFEVAAADEGPLVAFYAELFGWGHRPSPGGGHTMLDTRAGGGINGGIGRSRTGAPWAAFFVETDDPQAALDAANRLGGATVLPVAEVAGTTMAMFSDPDGLLIGLLRAPAGPSPAGAPSAGEGAAVDWFEVIGSDAARTQRFYTDLFGWAVDDTGLPGYAVVDTGAGRGIAGGIGGGADARWATVYAGVADVDQALSEAERLGGTRLAAPGVSALKTAARAALYGGVDESMKTAAFRDPAGNVFGLYHHKAG